MAVRVAARRARTGRPRAAARNHLGADCRRTCVGERQCCRAAVGRRTHRFGPAQSGRLVRGAGRSWGEDAGRMQAAVHPTRVRGAQRGRASQTRNAQAVGRRSERGPRRRGRTKVGHRPVDHRGTDPWVGCPTTSRRGHAGCANPPRARRWLPRRRDGTGRRRSGGSSDRPGAGRRSCAAPRPGAGQSAGAIQRRSGERSSSLGVVDPA